MSWQEKKSTNTRDIKVSYSIDSLAWGQSCYAVSTYVASSKSKHCVAVWLAKIINFIDMTVKLVQNLLMLSRGFQLCFTCLLFCFRHSQADSLLCGFWHSLNTGSSLLPSIV